jgi:hypothetical protein
MAENVFVLGAGASREAGGPLMKTFLDESEALHRKGGFADPPEMAGRVFGELLPALQGMHAKAKVDLDNIEDLFGHLEMACITQTLANYDAATIKQFRNALIDLVAATLDVAIQLPIRKGKVEPPYAYWSFARHLGKLEDCAVISFNYDLAVDYAMYSERLDPDYCLKGRSSGMPLLKLHGSLNWAQCPECGEILPLTMQDYWRGRHLINPDAPSFRFDMGKELTRSQPSHPHILGRLPAIVPPSWNKTQYHAEMIPVWRQAAKELSGARNIYVIGYSLPACDLFFRSLYSVGTLSDTPLRRLWIFDPEATPKERFASLLGESVVPRLKWIDKRFSELRWDEVRDDERR